MVCCVPVCDWMLVVIFHMGKAQDTMAPIQPKMARIRPSIFDFTNSILSVLISLYTKVRPSEVIRCFIIANKEKGEDIFENVPPNSEDTPRCSHQIQHFPNKIKAESTQYLLVMCNLKYIKDYFKLFYSITSTTIKFNFPPVFSPLWY